MTTDYQPAPPPRLPAGDWLLAWLKSRGIKQTELAKRMGGLDPSIVQLWCAGKRPVAAGRIEDLAAALSNLSGEPVSTDHLWAWSRGEQPPPRPAPTPTDAPPAIEAEPTTEAAATGDAIWLTTKPQPTPIPLAALPAPEPAAAPMPSEEAAPMEDPAPPTELVPLPGPARLWWCNSDHGSGIPRRHHHGPRPTWAPGLLTTAERAS